MNLEAFALRLETAGVGVRQQTIFVHALAAGVTTGIMLREYFGGTDLNAEMPQYRKGKFQLVVRGSNYQATKTLINQAMLALNSDVNVGMTIPGITQLNYVRPLNEPFVYPFSDGSLWEFLVNCEACYVV